MTNETKSDDLIRYDVMVQEALVGVVRRILVDAARIGLPGEHHFYISFRTKAPGVRLSPRLREKFPEEMTVVLQHQFWDLIVTDQSFEVGLSFGGIAERLLVPFESMTGFYDPSVQFGLKFAADEAQADNDLSFDEEGSVKDRLDAITEHEKGKKGKSKLAMVPMDSEKPANAPAAVPAAKKPRSIKPKTEGAMPDAENATASQDTTTAKSSPAEEKPDPAPKPPSGGAEVVSLEAFRKKK